MIFNSFEFLVFLPVVFLLYWFVFKQRKLQNLFILVASYVFYGWWNWKFLFLIALTSTLSFVSGIAIERYEGKRDAQKWISAINIIFNLSILGVFKYYNFFTHSLEKLLAAMGIAIDFITIDLILPVGISFYTFQALSYSIDVYRGKIKAAHNPIEFFAFISFFPQLVAGPIERATNLLPQFAVNRIFNYNNAVDGMRLILWGLFKKIVIADNCAEYVNIVFDNQSAYSGSVLSIAGILFAFQIYGDFSGYSDIAIGTAKLFGIHLRDNFRTPYFSRDIAEFWKRWHISLNKWFVDYVYIPLGGSRTKSILVARNVLVIFLLSGLWHGANWTYISWGLYHSLLFLPLILLKKNKRNNDVVAADRFFPSLKELGNILVTFILATIGWVIFRSNNISDAFEILKKIINITNWEYPWFSLTYETPTIIAIVLCIIMEWINRKRNHGFEVSWVKPTWIRITIYYLILSMIILYSGKNITFIYFQF